MARVDDVAALLRRRGHRMTPQRREIVSIVMRTRGHIAPQDVLRRVRRRVPSVNESTVYRTLSVLEEVGVLSHAHLHDGAEYHHADASDHVHLTCSVCGRNFHLSTSEAAPMRRALRARTGFDADFTHFAIAGRCGDCVKK